MLFRYIDQKRNEKRGIISTPLRFGRNCFDKIPRIFASIADYNVWKKTGPFLGKKLEDLLRILKVKTSNSSTV